MPPVKAPAESNVPAVDIKVETAPVPNTINAPTKVPAPVIVNETGLLVEIEPNEAVPKLGVIRAANVGALVEPASVQPVCDAIVSVAAKAVNDTEDTKPIYGPVTV